MSKNKLFKTIPLSGGSKKADEVDLKVIEENLKRFNKPDYRNCLVCDEKFYSEGAHNHHCRKCKAKYGEELFENRRYHHRRGEDRRDCDKRKNYT